MVITTKLGDSASSRMFRDRWRQLSLFGVFSSSCRWSNTLLGTFFISIRHIRSMFLISYNVFKLHFMYLKFGRRKVEIVYLLLGF